MDRFIYVIGGNNGTSTANTVYRAEVLNPLDSPVLDIGVDVVSGNNSLAPGLWFYRVAAIFPEGGEALASDPLPVSVPNVQVILEFTLSWNTISGATSYRVYRTPSANSPLSSIQYLTDVTTNFYVETGLTTSNITLPRRIGSLGRWNVVGTLNSQREALATAALPNPFNSNQWIIYVLGGRNGVRFLFLFQNFISNLVFHFKTGWNFFEFL